MSEDVLTWIEYVAALQNAISTSWVEDPERISSVNPSWVEDAKGENAAFVKQTISTLGWYCSGPVINVMPQVEMKTANTKQSLVACSVTGADYSMTNLPPPNWEQRIIVAHITAGSDQFCVEVTSENDNVLLIPVEKYNQRNAHYPEEVIAYSLAGFYASLKQWTEQMIPAQLQAQVVAEMKASVGTFYHPQDTYIDFVSFLRTRVPNQPDDTLITKIAEAHYVDRVHMSSLVSARVLSLLVYVSGTTPTCHLCLPPRLDDDNITPTDFAGEPLEAF